MSSSAKKLFQQYPALRKGIEKARFDILGQLPNLNMGRTGHQIAKQQFTGHYLEQYYLDHHDKYARMIDPTYKTELQERQAEKLYALQRRGKGPPKKGAGARAKKR